MKQISTLRTLLENTEAALSLLMEMTDEQLNGREKVNELSECLLQEREAADELVAGLRDVHIGSGPRGMGFKSKRAHLEELIAVYGKTRDELAAMLREGGDARAEARAEARAASVVEDIVPSSEEEVLSIADVLAAPIDDCEEEEVQSLVDVIAENIEPWDDEEPDTARATSLYDSIRRLGLRKNAVTALEKADICNLGQLISQSSDYLLSLHQFGATSLDHVLVGLDALGLDWPNGKPSRAPIPHADLPIGGLVRDDATPNLKEEEDRRHKAAVAKQYYRKNRKRILNNQAAYRQAQRARLQEHANWSANRHD